MKNIMQFGFALTMTLGASQAASAQATITGPSTWAAGQPTTVTWSGTSTPVCAGGVRVTLNLGTTRIQTGTAVPLSAGRASVPGTTLSAGTAVSLTLTDQCTGKVLTAAHPVTITGSTAPVVPVAAAATTTITPAIRQNIDTACQGVLGSPCSTSASYSSTYTAITQQITQGSLKSDSASVMYSYLIPMVQSSASWKANVVDNAWRGAGCTGTAPEAQWTPKAAQWQTYAALVNTIKQQGCAAAAGNVAAPAPAATQYLTAQQMTAGYNQVWGSAASKAYVKTNCPVSAGAASCARSDLAAYVKANGNAILQTIASTPYQSVVGQSLDSSHLQTVDNAFGANWTGADDLVKYLQANPRLYPPTVTFGGLDTKGCFINSSGAKLAANEPCGNYYLDSKGAHAPGAYTASLNGVMVILTAANPGGGVMVTNQGKPVKVVVTPTSWAIGYGIVAQGGGNIVAQGGGNIVAQGGGNIVAQGGGNIVAQGGGNIVAQGGGNLIEDGAAYLRSLTFTDPASAARTAGLITPGGASIISQDGNGFLPNMNQVAAIASLIGENSSGIVGFNGSGVTAANSGAAAIASRSAANSAVAATGASGLTYSGQSVSAAKAAVITGPATWTYGQPAMITWNPTPGTAACPAGYEVLINGAATGNPVTLTLGKSLLQPGTWPRGTKLSVGLTNLCDGTTVAALYTTTIQ